MAAATIKAETMNAHQFPVTTADVLRRARNYYVPEKWPLFIGSNGPDRHSIIEALSQAGAKNVKAFLEACKLMKSVTGCETLVLMDDLTVDEKKLALDEALRRAMG